METVEQFAELKGRFEALEAEVRGLRAGGGREEQGPLASLADQAAERVAALDARRRREMGEVGLVGEKNIDMILAALRRLDDATGATGTSGSSGSGTGPATWAGKTTAEKVETLKGALCGASISAVCNGDGTIAVTLNLPSLPC